MGWLTGHLKEAGSKNELLKKWDVEAFSWNVDYCTSLK